MGTESKKRSVEESVAFALGHPVRIEILAILHEATRSPSELCSLLRLPMSTVAHHVKELANSDSVELVRVEKVRNAEQKFYRAIKLPILTDEQAAALEPNTRQQYAALILQAMTAEAMSALLIGTMKSDPNVCMMWDWYLLDAEGRQEFVEEQRKFWERLNDVRARSANRRASSGEEGVTMIAATMGFERGRPVGAALASRQAMLQGNSE